MPSTDSATDVAAQMDRLAKKKPAPERATALKCGDDNSGLLVNVGAKKLSVLLEPRAEGAWGSGRRAHLVPVP